MMLKIKIKNTCFTYVFKNRYAKKIILKQVASYGSSLLIFSAPPVLKLCKRAVDLQSGYYKVISFSFLKSVLLVLLSIIALQKN